MKKETKKYRIKFFTEKDGYWGHKSKELEYFQEEIFSNSNSEAFKIGKNTLFNICKNEPWAANPLKEELLNLDNLNNLDDILDNNNNYDYNKIINNNDDPCDPNNKIIMERGDSRYYHDCKTTYFKVFKIKKIKKNNQ